MKTAEKKKPTVQKNSKKKTAMPERKRKITKVSPIIADESIDDVETMEERMEVTAMHASPMKSRIMIVAILVLGLIGFGAYKYRYVLVPATVNGEPIYVWNYLWKLHTQFGRDQINSMATEMMISQAVAQSKVDASGTEVDAELASIEKEASSSGGLKAVLQAQGMSMEEFRNRIRLQLAVKKILADKIKVSDQEVEEAYKKNKDFYKGMAEPQAKEAVKKQLEDQKFQTEVSTWLSDVKSKAKIDIKFPGFQQQ